MLCIKSIKKQKAYPTKPADSYLPLAEYIKSAKKIIAYFCPRINPNLTSRLLKNEDAISSVAHGMMMGDWRWDIDYGKKHGVQRTQRAYRVQCGIWALQGYIKSFRGKKGGPNLYSIDMEIDESPISAIMSDGSNHVRDVDNKDMLDELLSNVKLSEQQKQVLEMVYFGGMTQANAARELGVSRENVRQLLTRAIKEIRVANNVEENS